MFQIAVTFRLLNRFRSSWYVRCVARAENHEYGIDNCVPQFLIGERVPGVSDFFFLIPGFGMEDIRNSYVNLHKKLCKLRKNSYVNLDFALNFTENLHRNS